MNEEFKITMPSITETELAKIDNNLHELVNEFIKTTVKDKDLLISQHIIKRLEDENKQLKEYCCKRNECSGRLKENRKLTGYEIINELEKWLEKRIKSYEDRKELGPGYELTEVMQIELTCDRRYLRKIKELKGSDK